MVFGFLQKKNGMIIGINKMGSGGGTLQSNTKDILWCPSCRKKIWEGEIELQSVYVCPRCKTTLIFTLWRRK